MSRFTRNRKKARKQREDAGIEAFIKRHQRLLEYLPVEDTRFTCSYCEHWQPGDFWQTGEHGIEAEGRCGRGFFSCWNYRGACKHFVKKHVTGFFYQGGGKPVEEDIKNINELTKLLFEDGSKDN